MHNWTRNTQIIRIWIKIWIDLCPSCDWTMLINRDWYSLIFQKLPCGMIINHRPLIYPCRHDNPCIPILHLHESKALFERYGESFRLTQTNQVDPTSSKRSFGWPSGVKEKQEKPCPKHMFVMRIGHLLPGSRPLMYWVESNQVVYPRVLVMAAVTTDGAEV